MTPSDETSGRMCCFVIMPFGKKDTIHGAVDFDSVYASAIKPAVETAGLSCIRADAEQLGAIIHAAMFARLLLSEFVIADLSTSNPNVFYELGVKHTARRRTTILISSHPDELPFDFAPYRVIRYDVSAGELQDGTGLKERLVARIRASLDSSTGTDSPLFELLKGFSGVEIDAAIKLSLDRRAAFAEKFLSVIDEASLSERSRAVEILRGLEQSLGELKTVEPDHLIALLLAYRRVGAWPEVLRMYDRVPPQVRELVPVKRVLAMALALTRDRSQADLMRSLALLEDLLRTEGEDASTLATLGRVHLDLHRQTRSAGQEIQATGHLDRAIDAYTRSFRANPRDLFNAARASDLLLERGSLNESRRIAAAALFLNQGRLQAQGAKPNDWETAAATAASLVSLAIRAGDVETARDALHHFLSMASSHWLIATLAHQLVGELTFMLRKADASGNEFGAFLQGAIKELERLLPSARL